MQELYAKIENIDLKLRQLVHKIELLKKENKQLLEENSKIQKQNSQLIEEQKKLEIVANSVKGDIDSSKSNRTNLDIKVELDTYIKEIDSCIEMLQNA